MIALLQKRAAQSRASLDKLDAVVRLVKPDAADAEAKLGFR
ncbi:hypothetical protein [uncultured Tateyamaria sp.]|nr:hypothetical protein [uncultured Tateyamaria sp.]